MLKRIYSKSRTIVAIVGAVMVAIPALSSAEGFELEETQKYTSKCSFREALWSTEVFCQPTYPTTTERHCVAPCVSAHTNANAACTDSYNYLVAACRENEIGPGKLGCDKIVKCQAGTEEQRRRYCIENVACLQIDIYCKPETENCFREM